VQDLDDGENTTDKLNLIVSVSKKKHDAMENVDYVVTLRAYSLNCVLSDHYLDFHFKVKFKGGVEILGPIEEYWALPGSSVKLDFKIINKGNGPDSFFSYIEPIRGISRDSGWTAYIVTGYISNVISRNDWATVTVEVNVPPDAPTGNMCRIVLVSSSQKAKDTSEPADNSATVTMYASRSYKPVLESQMPYYDVYPGRESIIYFNVTNDGNTKDRTIDLKITTKPGGWAMGLDTSEIPETGLGFKTTAEIGLKMILPDDVPARDGYIIMVEAWAGDPLIRHDTLALRINVLEKYAIELSATETIKSGYVGGIVEYTLNVKNAGNVEDTFFIDAYLQNTEQYPDWVAEPSEPFINLSANMTRSVKIQVTIPLDAAADSNPKTSSVFEGYTVVVKVTSHSDHLNASKKKQFITRVYPFYGFHLASDIKSLKVSADRNNIVPITIEIQNIGNVKDIADLTMESEETWYTLVSKHKLIPHKETRRTILQIEPYKGVAIGVYEFTLVATSRGDKTYNQAITLTVDVVSYNFKVQNVRIYDKLVDEMEDYDENEGYKIKPSTTVLIQAEIVNTGSQAYISGPYGDVVVTFYYNKGPITKYRVNFSYMETYSTPNDKVYKVSLPWEVTQFGTQEIRIVIDGQNNIPESNEEDNTASVKLNMDEYEINKTKNHKIRDTVVNYIIPTGISLLIVVIVILTFYIISTIRVTYVDTGYDEEGKYKPFAEQYDAFEDDEEEVEEEEEELEIEYDMDHPYLTASPYQVAQVEAAPTPYALPPASPYSQAATKANEPLLALPPAEKIEEPIVLTKPVATKPVTTKPPGKKVVTSKPVTTRPPGKKVVTSKPATTRPPTKKVVTTKPVGKKVVTTKPVTKKPGDS
jgi:hypothetical protein